MADLTADQLAQANQLHGAVGWVYPDTSNTAFWDNFFNSTTPTLTPDEQASGISIGPMPSSTRPNIPFGPASQQPQQPQVLPGIDSTTPDMLGAGPRQFNLTPTGGYNGTPQVVGAANNAPMGAGNVPYQSELIRSLRAANQAPTSNNPGVTMLPNPQNSTLTLDFNRPVPTGLSNKPQKLQIKPVDPTPLAPDTPVGGGGGDGGGGSGGGTGGGGGPIVIGPLNPVDDDDKDTDGLDDLINDLTKDDGNDSVDVDDKDTDGLDKLIDDLTKDDGTDPDQWDPGNDSGGDDTIPDYSDDLWGDGTDDVVDTDVPDYTNDLWGGNAGGDESGGSDDFVDTFDPIDDINNDDADADAIAQLYRDILGREADEAGLEWWDQTGLGVDDIADFFRGSDEYATLNADPDIPDYSDDLWGDDVDTSIGIDLGQADDLGGIFEMYDPLDNSSPIVFDMKGEDYGTNFGSDWLMDALFGGDFSGGGGGGRGGPMILFAQE